MQTKETVEMFLARGGAVQTVAPASNPDHDLYLRNEARRTAANRARRSHCSRSRWFVRGEGTV